MLDISGFLIVDPIRFSESFAAYFTSGWVSDIAFDMLLTIAGNLYESCFGLQ